MATTRAISRVGSSIVGALLIGVCGANAVFAQAVTGTGFKPTFGGTGQAVTVRQHVDATVSVVEGADSNASAAAAAGAVTPTPFQQDGFYTEVDPALSAGWRGEATDFTVSAASVLRSYGGDLQDVFVGSNAVQLNLNSKMGRRSKFSLSEGASYAPAFLSQLSSNAPVALDLASSLTLNSVVDTERSFTSMTNIDLSHDVGQHTAVSVNSDLQYTTYSGDVPGYASVHFYHLGGHLSRNVSKNMQLRIGYRFGEGQYQGLARPTNEQNIEVGIAYSRPLSRTRRSTMAFTLGSTLTNGPLFGTIAAVSGHEFQWTGSASLNHQVSRTWSMQGSFQRGLTYVQSLYRPLFTDSVTAGTTGFLSRRADLSLSAAYSAGEPGASGSAPFTTYTGDARLRMALNRSFAIYGEYLYYFYNFERTLTLPTDVSSRLSRNGVRVGLTLWVPVRQR